MQDVVYQFSKEEIEEYFKMLGQVLSVIPLKHEDGDKFYASAGDFMLMHKQGTSLGFKHCDTRNYVFLDLFSGRLTVPETEQPWMRGYF